MYLLFDFYNSMAVFFLAEKCYQDMDGDYEYKRTSHLDLSKRNYSAAVNKGKMCDMNICRVT